MSTIQTPLEDDVREYLRNRHENGNSYVRIKTIAAAIDEDSRAITPVVRELVHEGALEVWNKPKNNSNLYRIDDVDELDDRPVWDRHAEKALGGESA